MQEGDGEVYFLHKRDFENFGAEFGTSEDWRFGNMLFWTWTGLGFLDSRGVSSS